MFFGTVEFERRQEFSIGHRLQMIGVPADADELLDVRVPWGDFIVCNRPVHPVAELLRSHELVLTPALARAPPDDRLTADLVSANPVEWFLLDVRVVAVLDEE